MRTRWLIIGLILGLSFPAVAALIPSPPILEDKEAFLYFRRIYDNQWNEDRRSIIRIRLGFLNVVSKTSAYTATVGDDVILVDTTSANVTITLPATASTNGLTMNIKKTDSSSNDVIVDGNGCDFQ